MEPRRQTKCRTPILAAQTDQLRALVAAKPDRTLVEIRAALGNSASLTTIWPALERLDVSVKRKFVRAAKQGRPNVARARQAWGLTMTAKSLARWGLPRRALDNPSFLAYVEQVLVPTLRPTTS